MNLIGIVGKMGSGKDTLAETLMAHNPRVARIALADGVKNLATALFDLNPEQAYGSQEAKARIDERWEKSPRQLLQLFGTEVGRACHKDVWVRYLLREIKARESAAPTPEAPVWVVPDVRFPNEADAIRAAGGVVVRIFRPFQDYEDAGHLGWVYQAFSRIYGVPMQECRRCHTVLPLNPEKVSASGWHRADCIHRHPSEVGVEEISPDVVLDNSETLEQFREKAIALFDQILADRGW